MQETSKERGTKIEGYGLSGAEELSRLRDAVDAARDAASHDPSLETARLVAEKRLELFLNEHDNAGAFKFKRFGREIRDMFFERDEHGEPRASLDDEGRLVLSEKDRGRRLLFVNMGELDRFNKEGGGHAAGDAALAVAAGIIERRVREALDAAGGDADGYRMYRFSGSEFAVNVAGLSEADAARLVEDIEASAPTVAGVDEPAPLTATEFGFGDAGEIFNGVQEGLGPEGRVEDAGDAARETVDVVKTRAYYDLDVRKFTARVRRVKEKLEREGEEATSVFFETYMKKVFTDTPFDTLSAIADATDEDVDRQAFAYARKHVQQEAAFQDVTSELIASRLQRRRDRATSEIPAPLPSSSVLATIPRRTRGQEAIAALEAKADAARAAGDADAAELADLDLRIETARRDAGTGLLERGVHYADAAEAFREGRPQQLVFIDMGFLKYFDYKGGADVGDAALRKAAELMERAIDEAGVDGTAYRYGGDEFTVRIEGDEEDRAAFLSSLESLRADAGAIPTGRRGETDGYVPTSLVFNYGTADSAFAEDVLADLREAGAVPDDQLDDPGRVAELKADIMTVAADRAIEGQKAVERFRLLIDRLRDGECQRDARCASQTEQMITFSQKAIYGELGGDARLREWAASSAEGDELRDEIERWTSTQRVRTLEAKEGSRELMVELIEAHAKIRRHDERLRAAERLRTAEEREDEAIRAEIDAILEDRRRAEEERRRLIETRKRLDEL